MFIEHIVNMPWTFIGFAGFEVTVGYRYPNGSFWLQYKLKIFNYYCIMRSNKDSSLFQLNRNFLKMEKDDDSLSYNKARFLWHSYYKHVFDFNRGNCLDFFNHTSSLFQFYQKNILILWGGTAMSDIVLIVSCVPVLMVAIMMAGGVISAFIAIFWIVQDSVRYELSKINWKNNSLRVV